MDKVIFDKVVSDFGLDEEGQRILREMVAPVENVENIQNADKRFDHLVRTLPSTSPILRAYVAYVQSSIGVMGQS